ncbi:MAG TPA: hypothetical protein VFO77_08330, partial [Actinoplanes sp.]|nr:hypothetical protein [Actinoplanes sp.]
MSATAKGDAIVSVYYEPVGGRPYPGAWALRAVSSADELTADLAARPDTCLIVLGPTVPFDEAVAFAARHRLQHPTAGLVLLRDEIRIDVLAEAMRAGIREVVAVTEAETADAACARSVELSLRLGAALPAAGPAEAQVVTVFAGKGGVGKSTVATNLA